MRVSAGYTHSDNTNDGTTKMPVFIDDGPLSIPGPAAFEIFRNRTKKDCGRD